MSLEKRIAAANGRIPADLVIKNCRVVSVTSGRIIENDIAIADGVILGLGRYKAKRTIDAHGLYVSSGFMDAHMHLESTLLTPAEFAKVVVPLGTTAVFIDPHEITNVMGVKGIDYILKMTENLPLDFYIMLPSCVPATNLETSGGRIEAKDLERFWGRDRVIGLAEVMNCPGVINCDPKIMAKIKKSKGHTIDGHAPSLAKKDLNAYLMANIRSDHESTTKEEASVKLAAGLHLMIREGTSEKNLEELLPVVTKSNAHRCMFCTDDRSPIDLLKEGHINYLIRKAIRLGLPPITAIQMATLNTAEYFRLTEKQGAVAVGHKADLLLFDDFKRMNIKMVFKNGELVARDGRLISKLKGAGSHFPTTMKIKGLSSEVLKIKAKGGNIRVIKLVPRQIVTGEIIKKAKVKDGVVISNVRDDILKLAVVERHRGTGNVGLGFVKGFGLRRGAIASSVAHDSHNIVVVGANDADMLNAVEILEAKGGGFVVVDGGRVLEILDLPIAGLISDRDAKFVDMKEKDLRRSARSIGCRLTDPFQSLSFLALSVIPKLRLTDMGLVDATKLKFVDLFVSPLLPRRG